MTMKNKTLKRVDAYKAVDKTNVILRQLEEFAASLASGDSVE